jgi:thiol-disulfide isomerase/thioredoxin
MRNWTRAFALLVFGSILWTSVDGWSLDTTDELRTWSDSSGKFSVKASLVAVEDGQVILKTPQGKEIKLPVDRLSQKDKDYLERTSNPSGPGMPSGENTAEGSEDDEDTAAKRPSKRRADKSEPLSANDATNIRELATRFYSDLRNKERIDAQSLLTEHAITLAKENQSALLVLPMPDDAKNAIKVGKPKKQGQSAVVPVIVRIDGKSQSTMLHLRQIEDQWRVFAISAKLGDYENTVNFELPIGGDSKSKGSLADLINQPIQVSGLTLDGRNVSLADYRGKVVLIDFWATWCGPCKAEIPNIFANYQKYHSSGFEVIAISLDSDLQELQEFVTTENPPWVTLADRHPLNRMSMSSKFGISGIPAFILVGADGKVIDTNCRGEKLGQRLAAVLGK